MLRIRETGTCGNTFIAQKRSFKPKRITCASSTSTAETSNADVTRRQALALAAAALPAVTLNARPANAVQGLTAGRIPGACGAELTG